MNQTTILKKLSEFKFDNVKSHPLTWKNNRISVITTWIIRYFALVKIRPQVTNKSINITQVVKFQYKKKFSSKISGNIFDPIDPVIENFQSVPLT